MIPASIKLKLGMQIIRQGFQNGSYKAVITKIKYYDHKVHAIVCGTVINSNLAITPVGYELCLGEEFIRRSFSLSPASVLAQEGANL